MRYRSSVAPLAVQVQRPRAQALRQRTVPGLVAAVQRAPPQRRVLKAGLVQRLRHKEQPGVPEMQAGPLVGQVLPHNKPSQIKNRLVKNPFLGCNANLGPRACLECPVCHQRCPGRAVLVPRGGLAGHRWQGRA